MNPNILPDEHSHSKNSLIVEKKILNSSTYRYYIHENDQWELKVNVLGLYHKTSGNF